MSFAGKYLVLGIHRSRNDIKGLFPQEKNQSHSMTHTDGNKGEIGIPPWIQVVSGAAAAYFPGVLPNFPRGRVLSPKNLFFGVCG